MPESVQGAAFCPAHITGFFHICDAEADELRKGSLGAGFSLARGVTTTVRRTDGPELRGADGPGPTTRVFINGAPAGEAPVSIQVLELFFAAVGRPALRIEHQIDVPMGAGLGTSGAGALSLAYALNRLYGLPLSQEEAARIAHRADVRCRTGLGTVMAETVGGLEIRTRAGAPGTGEVTVVPVPADIRVLCLIFGPLSTSRALGDPETRAKINELGWVLVEKFRARPTTETFLEYSREFAEHSGLITPRVRAVMDALTAAGITCSMPMFGEGIFTLLSGPRLDRAEDIITPYKGGGVIIRSRLDTQGGRIINAA
jgi:pantoate kinase